MRRDERQAVFARQMLQQGFTSARDVGGGGVDREDDGGDDGRPVAQVPLEGHLARRDGLTQHTERGIAHFYTDQKSFDAAGHAVELMRQYGVQRRLVSRDELLQIEPAFRAYGDRITGGTYTSTDESDHDSDRMTRK